MKEFDVCVIGGGIAGLVSSILLSKKGLTVAVFESGKYPRHKVCGEYVSNEIVPFLMTHDLYPSKHKPPVIDQFQLSDTKGRIADTELDMGGFGISRFHWDLHLSEQAKKAGVTLLEGAKVREVRKAEDDFVLSVNGEEFYSKLLIGAHGKRSILDKSLDRRFMKKKSPYVGVKYHARGDFPEDLVSLHNFNGGYCGVNAIEDGLVNVCYLSHRDNFREYGSLEEVQEIVLFQNPTLKRLLLSLEPVFEKPLVINEITFETKEPVEAEVMMCGDAAGMITPLCGNGMAMAVRSAKLLSEQIIEHWDGLDKKVLYKAYIEAWNSEFKRRLAVGRHIQGLFGGGFSSGIAVGIARNIKPLTNQLVSMTHGQVLE
jgi:flavin-dependent dehydrogenase